VHCAEEIIKEVMALFGGRGCCHSEPA
jgi:hypothetical protein